MLRTSAPLIGALGIGNERRWDMLEALGAIGSFIGGIGVVVSVVYLAFQIKLNTISNRSQSYQLAISSISEWSRQVGLDKDATRIIRVGVMGLSALDENERAQFSYLLVSLLRNFENIHHQFDNGTISKETWLGWSNRIIVFLSQPGAKEWWDKSQDSYSPRFRTYVDEAKSRAPGHQDAPDA